MSSRSIIMPGSRKGRVKSQPAQSLAAAQSHHRRQRMSLMVVAFVALGMAAITATRVLGQQAEGYDSLPMHPKLQDEKVVKSVRATTKQFATTGDGNPKMVSAFFGLYVPALMTAPDGVKHISELVEEINLYLARAGRADPAVNEMVTGSVFGGMTRVAEGNYNPAARIAATILLSRLDARPADTYKRTPPVPLPAVLPVLLKLYQDEKNVDGVRAAALQGLHRYVTYGFPRIPDDAKTTLANEMKKLLQSESPADRPSEAHAYLQRFAVDILNMLRPKNDSELGMKLISISSAPKSPDLIALHSAARLAGMGKDLKGKVEKPDEILNSWARRAMEAFESELARLAALDRPLPDINQPSSPNSFLQENTEESTAAMASRGGGASYDPDMSYGGDMMMGRDMGSDMMYGMDMDMDMDMDMGMGMGMAVPQANPQPPEVIASRRKLNHVLQQLHLGATGMAAVGMPTKEPGGLLASVGDDKKAEVQKWVSLMKPIVEALNDKMLDDRIKYKEGLEAQLVILREYVGDPEEEVLGPEGAEPAVANPVTKDAAIVTPEDIFGTVEDE